MKSEAPPPAAATESPPPAPVAEQIAADTPKATVAGNTFVAPAGWSMTVRGAATILSAPENDDSHVVLVGVEAPSAELRVQGRDSGDGDGDARDDAADEQVRLLRTIFRRKLLEVLFDGRSEADAEITAAAGAWFKQIESDRKLLVIPPDAEASGKLAAKYGSPVLGDITVARADTTTSFDFGEWKSEMATRKNLDGTTSFITITPGARGFEFLAGSQDGKRALILRDAQHEYAFIEK